MKALFELTKTIYGPKGLRILSVITLLGACAHTALIVWVIFNSEPAPAELEWIYLVLYAMLFWSMAVYILSIRVLRHL
jgi:hypothetical protein